jgi:uncharacterized protein with NAD-binding domain and iron-sulfur cluster
MAAKKIAVLGGGMASLTAAYQLTSEPNWQEKYDITLYHMGWRLGGKGASGRNGNPSSTGLVSQRIEEHGLHLWFGFYDNAFKLIQQCYKDNNRNPNNPLATWQQAFKGYNSVVLEEYINGEWLDWEFNIPPNNLIPGDETTMPTIYDYIMKTVDFVRATHDAYHDKKTAEVHASIDAHAQSEHMGFIRKLMVDIAAEGDELFHDAGSFLLHGAAILAKSKSGKLLLEVLAKLKEWIEIIAKDILMSNTELRRDFIIMDLGYVILKGVIEDGVVEQGFNAINNYDFRDWLTHHGAADITVNSGVVQGVYGLVFGGNKQYTFEAGTALRGLFRLGLTYKGHVYYRMLAGMGDTIFGPMYQVLQSRGVNFQFFNKVTNLGLSPDKTSIANVSIDVQATLKSGITLFNPLVEVNGLPCWPTDPDYSQLNEGDALKSQKINLESYYSTWQPVAQKTLQAGIDFDEVMLGISIGALPTITKEFEDTAWKNMLANVIPISTIAYQLWLSSSIEEMQWAYANNGLALVGSYEEPYDTWSDMSDLIVRETWPDGFQPKNIAYFCGPTPQPYADQILNNAQTGNFSDPTFPQQQKKVAQIFAADYLKNLSKHLWPGLWKEGQTDFDFTKLIDLENGQGVERFNAQFFRANIDPTELYVMSFTNSSSSRIKTDGTPYNNLFITGDWIDNGFNAGCIEATVMSGLQAARALSGVSIDIPGEKDGAEEIGKGHEPK